MKACELLLAWPEVLTMKRWTWWLAAALATTAAVPLAATAQADEKKEHETPISMDKLPSAARDTLQREATGGQLIDVVEETDNGRTVYEGHIRKGDQVLGIEVDAKGNVVKRENETNEKH